MSETRVRYDIPETRNHHLLRLLPTYRLEPKQKFNKEKCEVLMKSLMDASLDEFAYDSTEAESLASSLSEAILSQVKQLKFDRYKFVCIVTIAENSMQGLCEMCRCLWDKKLDNSAVNIYKGQNLIAIATLYAFHFD